MYYVVVNFWQLDEESYNYSVVKVFTDKGEAEAFCKMKNETSTDPNDSYTVEEETEKG